LLRDFKQQQASLNLTKVDEINNVSVVTYEISTPISSEKVVNVSSTSSQSG
jgi:hypothetical protein